MVFNLLKCVRGENTANSVAPDFKRLRGQLPASHVVLQERLMPLFHIFLEFSLLYSVEPKEMRVDLSARVNIDERRTTRPKGPGPLPR